MSDPTDADAASAAEPFDPQRHNVCPDATCFEVGSPVIVQRKLQDSDADGISWVSVLRPFIFRIIAMAAFGAGGGWLVADVLAGRGKLPVPESIIIQAGAVLTVLTGEVLARRFSKKGIHTWRIAYAPAARIVTWADGQSQSDPIDTSRPVTITVKGVSQPLSTHVDHYQATVNAAGMDGKPLLLTMLKYRARHTSGARALEAFAEHLRIKLGVEVLMDLGGMLDKHGSYGAWGVLALLGTLATAAAAIVSTVAFMLRAPLVGWISAAAAALLLVGTVVAFLKGRPK